MLQSSIGRFRLVGLIEGLSYIILLVIAMPLKYVAGYPLAVTIVGSAHGFLFVLFVLLAVYIKFKKNWSFRWLAGAFIASVIPFGTFVLDRQLRKEV